MDLEYMNNHDENKFQFLREKLKKEVKAYIEIDDKIKALAKAQKEYRKTKENLSHSILDSMKKFEINDMNIKSGKLIYNERITKKTLNRKNLITGLTSYFKEDIDRAKDCSEYVLAKREDITKVTLKRKINRSINID